MPRPTIIQPEERVKELRVALEMPFGPEQRVNIEALIRMYENGELGPLQYTDPPIYLVDGVRVEEDYWERAGHPAIRWCEVCHLIPTSF